MNIKQGDELNFKIQPRSLLAGTTGTCRINSFEKSRNGMVVYIDTKQDDDSLAGQRVSGSNSR